MPSDIANRLLEEALAIGPRCGQTHVIAIDGPSGSGKTTVAQHLRGTAEGKGLSVAVLATDEICPGWDGLREVPDLVDGILRALEATGAATYPIWDWHAGTTGPLTTITATDVLIIEGVGSASRRVRTYLSGYQLLDAPEAERKARALGRDGEDFAPHWDQWAAAERAYFASNWP